MMVATTSERRPGGAGSRLAPLPAVLAALALSLVAFPARAADLNPWGAAHAPLDTARVTVGAERYRPRPFEAEVSLKVGWGARVSP